MNKGKLKLLDIDPLELGRQLTIMEFALYRKIKAIECLQRSREQKVGEHKDHITDVIQMTNKVGLLWTPSVRMLIKIHRLQIGWTPRSLARKIRENEPL